MTNKNNGIDTPRTGELIKQITNLPYNKFGIEMNTYYDTHAEPLIRDTVKEVIKILDAGSADFPPEWDTWMRKQPEWVNRQHIDLKDMWQRYAWEMRDWRKKWLGEAEQK